MSSPSELDAWMAAAGDADATIEAEAMLAGLRRAMFAVDEAGATLGRYEALTEIGRGGMGVVYRAFDPKLRRHVAIKVLRGGFATDVRLRREAQALARVSHPNVVQVLEVGAHRREFFVVMEYVDGEDAARWATRRQSWRRIVEVYAAAGDGLAAAHARGLVHRDFKPSNVLIAEDGRVLVSDFGLAHWGGAGDGAAQPSGHERGGEASRTAITRTGARLGTPRYMAPEQRAGGNTDEAADQWALACSVFEALYDRHPDDGPRRSASSIPPAVHRVLVRALSPAAADRFPDLAAFVGALRDASRRRQGRFAVAVAIAALGATTVFALAAGDDARCDGSARVAQVWSPARRDAGRDAFSATGLPYAEKAWSSAQRSIDDYTERWTRAYARACDMPRGAAGPCLSALLIEVDALVESFASAEHTTVTKAGRAGRDLSPPRACLQDATRAAADPAALDAHARLRARVQSLAREGRWREAAELARTLVASAEALGDPWSRSDAAYRLGMNLRRSGEHADADPALRSAYYAAAEAELPEAAARAAIGMVLVAERHARFDEGMQWARHATVWIEQVPDAEELRKALLVAKADLLAVHSRFDESLALLEQAWALCGRDPTSHWAGRLLNQMGTVQVELGNYDRAEALLLASAAAEAELVGATHPHVGHAHNNLGNIHYFRGEYARARAAYQRAFDIWEATLGRQSDQTATAMMNLGISAQADDDPESALAMYEAAEEAMTQRLGSNHPRTALILQNRAVTLGTLGRFEERLRVHDRALEIYRLAHGENHADVGEAYEHKASALHDLGRYEEAIDNFEHALPILAEHHGSRHPLYGLALHNLGLALSQVGDAPWAARLHRQALAIAEQHFGPTHPDTTVAYVGVAGAELELGRAREAAIAAEAVRASEGGTTLQQGLAAFYLAQARAMMGTDRSSLPGLVDEARAHLRNGGRGAEPSLEELEAWAKKNTL